MKLKYLARMSTKYGVQTPTGIPCVKGAGKGWRILLVGNGITHGWGMRTHESSLVGQLSEALESKRGFPVTIDYVGDELMNAQTVTNWISDVNIDQYDAIVVALGWNDAVRLTPERIWRKSLTEFIGQLRTRRRDDAGMVIVGIEPIKSIDGYNNIFGTIGQTHAAKLNSFLEEISHTDGDRFVPLGERLVQTGGNTGSYLTYHRWAGQIAAALAHVLPAGEPTTELGSDQQEFSWIGAKRLLGFDGHPVPTWVGDLEKQAMKKFKTQVAQVTILENSRQWFSTHYGAAPTSVPRELSYCDYAAKEDGVFEVANAMKDDRFKHNAYLEQSHMVFYTGQALYSRDGDVVGSFCMLGAVARPKSTLRKRRFKKLADKAQAEIWQIEDSAIKYAKATEESSQNKAKSFSHTS
jgi:lysophospholipase L1-like esterase